MVTASGAGGAMGTATSTAMTSTGSPTTGGGAEFAPCPAAGQPCLILPFGDSITDGFGTPGGYRIELFRMALTDNHDISFVGSQQNGPDLVDGVSFPRDHEGHSGWKIDDIAGRVPNPAFSPTPHIVLLMIGTNDINQNDNLDQAPGRLGNLIDSVTETAPEALVVVASVTPLSFSADLVDAYNAAISPLVEERAGEGKHVMFVDQNSDFPTSELADGVHPNPAGYARMAGVWYEVIEPYLR
jgi:lysophospholipase L1-like esterase